MDIITSFHTHFIDFLHHLDHYHMIQGAIIALFFGVVVGSLPGLIIVPVLAAIVYIAADAVIPPLMNHGHIVMPVFDKALLQEGVTLYVAFLVAIVVVFAVKKLILSIRG
jgi:hypothetical protein